MTKLDWVWVRGTGLEHPLSTSVINLSFSHEFNHRSVFDRGMYSKKVSCFPPDFLRCDHRFEMDLYPMPLMPYWHPVTYTFYQTCD